MTGTFAATKFDAIWYTLVISPLLLLPSYLLTSNYQDLQDEPARDMSTTTKAWPELPDRLLPSASQSLPL